MEISKINLNQFTDFKSVNLVVSIYDFAYQFLDQDLELNQIIVSENIFDLINTVNFVYSKESKNINIIHKVGFLRNFEVYLDPNKKDDNIIFTNENKDIRILEIEF